MPWTIGEDCDGRAGNRLARRRQRHELDNGQSAGVLEADGRGRRASREAPAAVPELGEAPRASRPTSLSTRFADLPGIQSPPPRTGTALSDTASPWARRVGEDVGEAAKANEDDADWLKELSRAPWKLEADKDLAKKFALLDFARARASKQTSKIPPPTAATSPVQNEGF